MNIPDPDNPKVYDDPFERIVQPSLTDREHAEIVCCANDAYTNFSSLLLKADGACLLYEVVWFALWHMKKNPELGVEEALECGYHEWVK